MKKVSVLILAVLVGSMLFAQPNSISFNDVQTQVQTGASTLRTIAKYLLWAVIAFGILRGAYLIIVDGGSKMKEAIVSIIVALIVVAIGFSLQLL